VINAGQNKANEFIIHTGDVLLNFLKCSLNLIDPKVWSSTPDDIKFSTTFTFFKSSDKRYMGKASESTAIEITCHDHSMLYWDAQDFVLLS